MVRGGEVDVGVVLVVDSAALAVGVVGSGQFSEVACAPGVDPDDEDGEDQGEENDDTAEICTVALIHYIEKGVPGTMGSFLLILLSLLLLN